MDAWKSGELDHKTETPHVIFHLNWVVRLMSHCRVSLILFLLWSCAVAPARGENAEDRVYEGLADLAVIRDDVLKRYALMVRGESQRVYLKPGVARPLQINRIYKLQAGWKRKDLQYRAHGKVMGPESSNREFEFQYWTEFFRCDGDIKGRRGTASPRGYIRKEPRETLKEFLEKHRLSAVEWDPFDDLVLHPLFLENPVEQFGWIEQVFFRESELLSAVEITQGDIRSTWRWKHKNLDFEIELTQSKSHDYLPTIVKYKPKMKDMPGLWGNTEIRWKRHSELKRELPHVIEAAFGGPFGTDERHYHWVMDWKVGDQLSDAFFDCDSVDFRTHFSDLFDFRFDTHGATGGLAIGTAWETPKELSEDTKNLER